ncbi:MAG: GlsB/YeaQ/YmgE family stress response membrane protein [Proteobacteria bacterium]|nr:GlsB/YeaQ/YmgE family stress response membrane protein [Pseudomonadota bacterium]
MHYVVMGIVGLIVGYVARLVYPGGQHMGMIMTMGLGIAGSYLAGLVGAKLHGQDQDGFHPAGFFYSVLGALALIFVASRLHLV